MCVIIMWHLALIFIVLLSACVEGNSILQECAKYYRPKNYLDMLPNLNMPYVSQLPIPNNLQIIHNKEYMNRIQNIQPTSVTTTKVVTVKTKYVYKNPICVKYNKKQKLCKSQDGRIRESVDKLITKEYFLKNNVEQRVESVVDVVGDDENDLEADQFSLKVSFNKLEPSEAEEPSEEEEPRAFASVSKHRTPSMTPQKVKELLIEDRLDQLETILPEYHRRRTYETKTLYVTKTLSNKRMMATLVVKNCIPVGYDVCPRNRRSRRTSKIAKRTFDVEENQFFYG